MRVAGRHGLESQVWDFYIPCLLGALFLYLCPTYTAGLQEGQMRPALWYALAKLVQDNVSSCIQFPGT